VDPIKERCCDLNAEASEEMEKNSSIQPFPIRLKSTNPCPSSANIYITHYSKIRTGSDSVIQIIFGG
jgi:hypothetical protein